MPGKNWAVTEETQLEIINFCGPHEAILNMSWHFWKSYLPYPFKVDPPLPQKNSRSKVAFFYQHCIVGVCWCRMKVWYTFRNSERHLLLLFLYHLSKPQRLNLCVLTIEKAGPYSLRSEICSGSRNWIRSTHPRTNGHHYNAFLQGPSRAIFRVQICSWMGATNSISRAPTVFSR